MTHAFWTLIALIVFVLGVLVTLTADARSREDPTGDTTIGMLARWVKRLGILLMVSAGGTVFYLAAIAPMNQ